MMIVFFFSFKILFIWMNPIAESNKFNWKEKVLCSKRTFRSKKKRVFLKKERIKIEFFFPFYSIVIQINNISFLNKVPWHSYYYSISLLKGFAKNRLIQNHDMCRCHRWWFISFFFYRSYFLFVSDIYNVIVNESKALNWTYSLNWYFCLFAFQMEI